MILPGAVPDSGGPERLRPGQPVRVAPAVTRIIAPNPGVMTGPGTNTYILGSDPLVLIDPGPDDDSHLGAILDAVGDGRLGWILVTHTHIDHAPLAVRLRERTGAAVAGFGPPAVAMVGPDGVDRNQTLAFDRLLADGDRLHAGELAIQAVHTPGHASNHLCFLVAGSGLLFSGDLVMSGSTVVIAPPDGDMAVYLESLEKVRALAPGRIAPGHGEVMDDPAAVVDGYLAHRREREAQVLAAVGSAPAGGLTSEQLVAVIYTGVPALLHPVARYSVWAHLRKLGAEGRARSADPDDIAAPWTLVR